MLCQLVTHMLEGCQPNVVQRMVAAGCNIAIFGKDQVGLQGNAAERAVGCFFKELASGGPSACCCSGYSIFWLWPAGKVFAGNYARCEHMCAVAVRNQSHL